MYQGSKEKRGKGPSIYQLQSLLRQKHSLKKCYVSDSYRVQLLIDRRQNPLTPIDRGEAETIIQASELQIRGHRVADVLIDDQNGRKIAQHLGLNVKGTVRVLALFNRDRIIKEAVRPLIEKCKEDLGFRISNNVVNQVLEEYGIE